VYVGCRVDEHRLLNIIKLVIDMDISNWFKQTFSANKKTKSKEKGWINLRLSIFWDVKNNKENFESEIVKIGQDMGSIFLNTKIIFNSNGEYMGTMNPYLGIDSVISCAKNTQYQIVESLSAFYMVEINKQINGEWHHIADCKKKKADKWRIEIKPIIKNKPKEFSLNKFNYELLGLVPLSDWVCKRYDYSAQAPSFNIIFIDGKPGIEEHDNPRLFKLRYLVEDRIKYGELNNPKLDKQLFGGSILDFIANVRNNKLFNKTRFATQEERNTWLTEVDKLIKKYNL